MRSSQFATAAFLAVGVCVLLGLSGCKSEFLAKIKEAIELEKVVNDVDPPYEFSIGVAVDGTGSGNVSGSTAAGSYPNNTPINCTASADTACSFTGWYDAPSGGNRVSTDNPYIFNLHVDTALYAAFSDNFQRILFISDRDGTIGDEDSREVYSISIDGSGLMRLTDNSTKEQEPDWRPDRNKIAYCSYAGTSLNRLYTMNSDGSNKLEIASGSSGQHYYLPDYSPVGNQIASNKYLHPYDQIVVMNADGTSENRLTSTLDDAAPDWSPDGSLFVYMSRPDGGVYDIYTMTNSGGDRTRLTNNAFEDRYPVWSPDGTKILFQSDEVGGDNDVVVMDADGSNSTPLTSNTAIADQWPDWSPDGSQIVFVSDRDGDFEIYIMDADGGNVTQITDSDATDIQPCW